MVTPGTLPPTPRTKRVIECAIENARKMGHNAIGTEHLLLGILGEDDNVAAQILFNMGISAEQIRAEIMRLLGIEFPDNNPLVESCLLCSKFNYCYATQSILERITGVLMGFITVADAEILAKDVFKLIAPKCKRYERKEKKDAK